MTSFSLKTGEKASQVSVINCVNGVHEIAARRLDTSSKSYSNNKLTCLINELCEKFDETNSYLIQNFVNLKEDKAKLSQQKLV